MKIFKLFKIITNVIHWCNLFKSKSSITASAENTGTGFAGGSENTQQTNVTTKMEPEMNEFFLKFCSDGFKKAVREKVIPVLRIVANETLNKIDDKIVKYLEELFKPEK